MISAKSETTQDEHVAPPEAWDAIAALYDEHVAPGEVELATAGLRLAGLRVGDTFLDVAAGTGGLSLPAARLGAKVLATDWSPKMIEHFTKRVAAEGLDAEGRVMDAHALDLPDDSYDVVGSQFGVMLVPDQPKALREMVRVTKPGGRVLLIIREPRALRGVPLLPRGDPGGRPRLRGTARRRTDARIPSRRSCRAATSAERCRSEERDRRLVA